jgi:hypothetical protein
VRKALYQKSADLRLAAFVVTLMSFSFGLAGCTDSNEGFGGTVAETVPAAPSQPLNVPANAVPITYTFVKDTPLIKETLLPLEEPTKSISMLISEISYGGVVCGFSFTGAKRPDSPVKVRFELLDSDGTVVESALDIEWSGDQEKAASNVINGWNFLSDAQTNRNGPGWVVQVGALPQGGGQERTPPKQAVCELTRVRSLTGPGLQLCRSQRRDYRRDLRCPNR